MKAYGLLAYVALGTALTSCAPPAKVESSEPDVHTAEQADTAMSALKTIGKLADKWTPIFAPLKADWDQIKAFLTAFDLAHFTTEEGRDFQALTAQITALGAAFVWYDNALSQDESWRALNSDLTSAIAQIEQSDQHPNDPNYPPFTVASTAYVDSGEYVAKLESDLHFLRYWDPQAYSGAVWRNFISLPDGEPFLGSSVNGIDAAAASKQFVYDWRIGVASVMMAIMTRIQIIAAADPGFTLDATRQEITQHRNTLAEHYQKMWDGVRCYTNIIPPQGPITLGSAGPTAPGSNGTSTMAQVMCADTNTGDSRYAAFFVDDTNVEYYWRCGCPWVGNSADCSAAQPECIASVDAAQAAQWDAINAKQVDFRNSILDDMPFYEMRALMNALAFYTTDTHDLTEVEQRIIELDGNDDCLDVQGGDPTPGTPVWMYPCTGSIAQRWTYDRTTERITDPMLSRCLDAQPQTNSPKLKVQISDCSSLADSQRWSYDPMNKRLYSGAASTGILIGGPSDLTLTGVDREINCPPGGFCGSHPGEFWFASQASHGLCQVGAALPIIAVQGDNCGTAVDQTDPYCAGTAWDEVCAGEVWSVCSQNCAAADNSF